MAGLKLPPAKFSPQYDAIGKVDMERRGHSKPHKIVGKAARYCLPLAVPFMIGQSPPIRSIQGKSETLIFAEQHFLGRHIYVDGRPHPRPETMQLTIAVHSIALWDDATLVVHTIGFIDQPGRFMPGGETRSHTSHIVERFKLVDNGRKLNVPSTWEDLRMFSEPPSLSLTYFAGDPRAFAMDGFCDGGDEAQCRSVVPPPQN
jgi:hypothetical protein